jgi:deazaflavin-dependent oxidoreductase (nitroreductase family)
MTFQKTPGGSRGRRGSTRANPLTRFMSRLMIRQHRRGGDRAMGMDLLYLSTKGAHSGEQRLHPLAYFTDETDEANQANHANETDAWLIVASAGGSANHPSWYHNIAAHPEDVWIEVGGQRVHVTPEQLDGEARAAAWQRITASQPRFDGYQRKTDRILPVIRLTRAAA